MNVEHLEGRLELTDGAMLADRRAAPWRMLPGRVYAQLTLLQQQEIIDRVGSRGKATYFIKAKRAADVPLPVNDLQRLHVEVSKAEKTVAFVFEGLHITVKVL